MRRIFRGDIYYAKLDPVIGSEQGGKRPVLIISNNRGNIYSPTVIIVPISSKISTRTPLPTHVVLGEVLGLDKNSVVLCEQIRAIDKKRLIHYFGVMPTVLMVKADKALIVSIALGRNV